MRLEDQIVMNAKIHLEEYENILSDNEDAVEKSHDELVNWIYECMQYEYYPEPGRCIYGESGRSASAHLRFYGRKKTLALIDNIVKSAGY